MRSVLIYNPCSGQVPVKREINEAARLLGRHGWQVTVSETTRPNQAGEIAARAAADGVDVVIAAGGDGTVSEAANGLINTHTSLGVLPVGTTNTWALQMGIPSLNPMHPGTGFARLVAGIEEKLEQPSKINYYRHVILKAAESLITGRTIQVDTGRIGQRHFLMWSGIGLDAAIVERVSNTGKKTLGSWIYALNAIGSGYRYQDAMVTLVVDGRHLAVQTPLIVVSNIQLYGGVMEIGARACINDGLLDICIFKGNGFFTFVRHAVKVLAHKHVEDPEVEYFQCQNIEIIPKTPLPVHADGEICGTTPVKIKVVPDSLKVIVPQALSSDLIRNK